MKIQNSEEKPPAPPRPPPEAPGQSQGHKPHSSPVVRCSECWSSLDTHDRVKEQPEGGGREEREEERDLGEDDVKLWDYFTSGLSTVRRLRLKAKASIGTCTGPHIGGDRHV